MTLPANNLLLFKVGPVTCCIDSNYVQIVIDPPKHITAIPGSNVFRPGLFSYRQKAVAVYDVRTKFNLSTEQRGKILLTEINNRMFGFWIDSIEEIIVSTSGQWQPLPVDCPKELFDAILLYKEQLIFKTSFDALAKAQVNTRALAFINTLVKQADNKKDIQPKKTTQQKDLSTKRISVATGQTTRTNSPEKNIPEKNIPEINTAVKNTSTINGEPPKNTPYITKTINASASFVSTNKVADTKDIPNKTISSPVKSTDKKTDQQTETNKHKLLSSSEPPISSINKRYQHQSKTPENKLNSHYDSIIKPVRTGTNKPAIKNNSVIAEAVTKINTTKTKRTSVEEQISSDEKTFYQSEQNNNTSFVILLIIIGMITPALSYYFLFYPESTNTKNKSYVSSRQQHNHSKTESIFKPSAPVILNDIEHSYIADNKSAEEKPKIIEKKMIDDVSNITKTTPHSAREPDIESKTDSYSSTEQVKAFIQINNNADTDFTPNLDARPSSGRKLDSASGADADADAKIIQNKNDILITINDVKAKLNTNNINAVENEKPEDIETIADTTKTINLTIEKETENNKTIQTKASAITTNKTSIKVVHIVIKGDTLWHIAKRYIHNPLKYKQIAKLSKIKNPDLIYPGNRVIIKIKTVQ